MAKKPKGTPLHDKAIALRIASADHDALEQIGVKLDRSVSWLIRTAIREFIERSNK